MTKEIVGVYKKKEDSLDKIRDLKINGYNAEKITIITNRKNVDDMWNETGVKVEHGRPKHRSDDSFMTKVTRILTDDITDPDRQLIKLGVPEEQANVHRHDLKSGKIIIVVDK